MKFISNQFSTFVLMVLPMAVVTAAVFLYRWRNRSRSGRNPLTKALLNAPGATLRAQLSDEQDNLLGFLLGSGIVGAYAGGFVAGQKADSGIGTTFWIATSCALIIGLGVLAWWSVRSFQRIQRLRLALDGEMAAGEALNHLMRRGYYVFHDIPGANYNIDHAIVGPNGVFAVETKAHAKPASGHKATFDGRVIRYPDRNDAQAVEQSQRNAASLSRFLSKATGRNIWVGAIVILPGWWVELTGQHPRCHVIASGQVDVVPKFRGKRLTAEEITAIAHQLEQLCRRESPVVLSDSDVGKYEPKVAI